MFRNIVGQLRHSVVIRTYNMTFTLYTPHSTLCICSSQQQLLQVAGANPPESWKKLTFCKTFHDSGTLSSLVPTILLQVFISGDCTTVCLMHLLAMSVAEAGVLNRGLSTYFNFLILLLEQCVFASPLNNKEYTCTIKVTFFLALTCFHQWRPLLQWCTHHPSAFWRWWSSQLHLLPAVQNTHQAGHPDTAGQLPGYDPSSSIYTPEGDTKNTCRYAVHC